ncbi:TfoX/Sxy family protein [Marinobacter sp. HL-58]|uniref:TfoX/Sxy family protein n=1 Tax=Marinobacter sp. HL-58 TaxID=1479237 RepID=UPI0004862EB7|nr:TfoX/Sxy family protein [Marinobacter sp. HL-58]KPP97668.1 MAG: putative regulator of competence [Marinobacter sp. HL-58]
MSEFVENLNDVFCQFGPVSVRRMFGGYGVYHDGLMFGLVADDVLYLKVDGESVGRFIELGLEPFEYQKNDAMIKMSYYMAPESIFEDPEQAKEWAALAFDAALRARKSSTRTKVKKQ